MDRHRANEEIVEGPIIQVILEQRSRRATKCKFWEPLGEDEQGDVSNGTHMEDVGYCEERRS